MMFNYSPRAVAPHHLARLWPTRNDDRTVVFANGHVFDREARRKSLRSLIQVCRRERSL